MTISPRPGQWLKFPEPVVVVNGKEGKLSEHFPEVCLTPDGKVVGIFSHRRVDSTGQIAPATVTPVDGKDGHNLGVINKLTSMRETMTFIEREAIEGVTKAREAMPNPDPPPICLGWPCWESLEVEAITDPAEIPPGRQTAEGMRLDP